MKVGDYVRTKKSITKIIDIRDELARNSMNGNEVVIETNIIITDNGLSVSNDYKSSSNIIDLIEDNDYVNGKRVIRNCLKDGGNIILFEDGTCAHNNDIKSIVTKEQFESMKYKVGD